MLRILLALTVLVTLLTGCQSSPQPPDTTAADGYSSASNRTTCESPQREQPPSLQEVLSGIVFTAAMAASFPVAIPLYICMAVTGTLPKC
jgi:hypothetical protein